MSDEIAGAASTLLTSQQIRRALRRMANQVLESHGGIGDLAARGLESVVVEKCQSFALGPRLVGSEAISPALSDLGWDRLCR